MLGLPGKSEERLRRAAAIAQDGAADPELRADEIGLLAIGGPAPRQALLQSLIDAKELGVSPAKVGGVRRSALEAVRSLLRLGFLEVAETGILT